MTDNAKKSLTKAPKKPSLKKRLNIVMDQAKYNELDKYAKAQYRTITAVIMLALAAYMKANPVHKNN